MSKVTKVPCSGCYACCQGEAVFIHPECGDDANNYLTEEYQGRRILAHKPNGDCIYLDRDVGCTIYDTRPTICGELDCRKLYKKLKYSPAIEQYLNKNVIKAAKRLIRKGRLA